MSDTQSDRSVLPSPGELRNKIYRNLVRKTYLALGPTSERPFSYNPPKPLAPSAGLVILRVSKATSSEALEILYEESVFLFKLDHTTRFSDDGPPHNARVQRPKRAVGLMNNVSLMSQKTMELFAGTARFRNVMRIRFIDSAEGDGYGYFITDHFDKAMEDLGGFRKLVVEFEAPGNPKLACEEAQVVLRSNCELIKYYKLKHFFEPIYGPGLHGTLRDVTNYTCYLELYPRQHLAKKLIAKAGKTLEEAARLGARELALASLPEIIEKLKLL